MTNINYSVPLSVLHETKNFLVKKGLEKKEAFVLWKGKKTGENQFTVSGIIIPEQTAFNTSFGFAFDISREAINKINEELHRTNEMGLIQVHSHPSINTKHSARDDQLSILNRLNALSIVLPNFGSCRFDDFSMVTVHIHSAVHKWEVLPNSVVDKILTVSR